jgi:hypothetical protein
MVREIGELFALVSTMLIFGSLVWSFVLACRVNLNLGWFWVLLPLWYPLFLFRHWKIARKSFFVLVIGLVVFALGFLILVATNPDKVS